MINNNAFTDDINRLLEAWVSLKRLERFMECSDVNKSHYSQHISNRLPETIITMRNATFGWDSPDSANKRMILRNIDLSVKEEQLVMVIGHVGSGKSSLLLSILGEMALLQVVYSVLIPNTLCISI